MFKWIFLDEMCQFLGPEIVKMGKHSFWPQKLTIWVSFWAQKLTLWARDTLRERCFRHPK